MWGCVCLETETETEGDGRRFGERVFVCFFGFGTNRSDIVPS